MALDKHVDSGEGPISGADFEETLRHAESLLDRIDHKRARIHTLQAVIGGFQTALVFGGVLALLWLLTSRSALQGVLAAVAGVLSAATVALLTKRLIISLHRQLSRDELIMIDLVDMLRELQSTLAKEEKWSYARIQLVRGRLSRFPIGAGSSRRRTRRSNE